MRLGQYVGIADSVEDSLSKLAVKMYDVLLIDIGLYKAFYGHDLVGHIKKQQAKF